MDDDEKAGVNKGRRVSSKSPSLARANEEEETRKRMRLYPSIVEKESRLDEPLGSKRILFLFRERTVLFFYLIYLLLLFFVPKIAG